MAAAVAALTRRSRKTQGTTARVGPPSVKGGGGVNDKVLSIHCFFVSLFTRRLPSSTDRRRLLQQVPCDQEAGLGPLLHRLAVLG